jgi:biopolymer transport protein ExbB
MWTLLLQAFDGQAAPVLYAILATASYVVSVALERAWFLWGRCRTEPDAVQLQTEEGTTSVTGPLGDDPIADVIRAGLDEADPELSWDAMSVAAAVAEEELFSRVPSLLTAGTVATMLGLLGTVVGLMVGFDALGDATAKAERLTAGVGAAMGSTAMGLIVGISATVIHGVLDARARQLLARVEVIAREVSLARRRQAKP